MKTRTTFAPFNEAVNAYFAKLFPQLVPLSIENGGPILAIQVENEYGIVGNVQNSTSDRNYMHGLADTIRKYFPDILLYTTDPAHAIAAGSLRGYSNSISVSSVCIIIMTDDRLIVTTDFRLSSRSQSDCHVGVAATV